MQVVKGSRCSQARARNVRSAPAGRMDGVRHLAPAVGDAEEGVGDRLGAPAARLEGVDDRGVGRRELLLERDAAAVPREDDHDGLAEGQHRLAKAMWGVYAAGRPPMHVIAARPLAL